MRPAVGRFLDRACPGSRLTPIAGDASTRQFFRVHPPSAPTLVLMDYGGSFRGETDDQRLARVFLAAGLPVARVLDSDEAAGCLLLDDLGSVCLESRLHEVPREGEVAKRLLERAVELAARVAIDGTPALERSERAQGPALDAARFRFEMDFFLENYAAGWLGKPPEPTLQCELYALADDAARSPRLVLCHRDYHSRNLILGNDETLAMVDIQDARWGPGTYDLASILRDAYVDIDESRVEPWVAEHAKLVDPGSSREEWWGRFETVSLQRMIKALGTFGYQIKSRGADRYRSSAERTIRRLRGVALCPGRHGALLAHMVSAGLLEA